jgi:hypothetical protein
MVRFSASHRAIKNSICKFTVVYYIGYTNKRRSLRVKAWENLGRKRRNWKETVVWARGVKICGQVASIAEPKLFVSGSFGSRAVAGARVAPSPAGTCVYHKVF